jgi:hypothetical protein
MTGERPWPAAKVGARGRHEIGPVFDTSVQDTRQAKMERRQVLKGTGVGLVAAAVAAPAIAQSAPTVRWRLATTFPKSLDTLYGACEMFSKSLADVSDQAFMVQGIRPGRSGPRLSGDRRRPGGHGGNGQHRLLIITAARISPLPSAPPCRSAINTRQMNAWLTYAGASTCSMIFTRPITSTACRSAIRPQMAMVPQRDQNRR